MRRLLSILVPLYNEEEFIETVLARILAAPLPEGFEAEIVIVDDGSTDGSVAAVKAVQAGHPDRVRLIEHVRNRGKGAAIRTALSHARGEFALIQDADLEYDPRHYPELLKPLVDGKADAVYGSRFMVAGERKVLYFWHSLANRILTGVANMAADLNLTDMETCYKAFRTSLVRTIPLRSERFGIEPELTVKLAQRQASIYEVPITYHGRTYEEGKKIGFRDAVQAVLVIGRYWLVRDIYHDPGAEILDAFSSTPRFNRWMADTIRPYLGESVLEIGAGMGNLSRHLARRRKRYIASDIDDEHLARLRNRLQHRPRLEVRRCDLSRADDFEPLRASVDTVVCLNVLEHIEDDRAALRNIHSALEPGGRAIILVPEGQAIYGQIDKVLGHWRRYSREQLQARAEEVGFQVERIVDFNRMARPGWYVNGKLLRRSTISRVQLRLFDRLVWLWRRTDAWLPWKPTSIIAIVRKPS
jgi:glycosyltransferase involved in cell wall biosynthesis